MLFAAVVAKPDPKWGEVPCAFIELKDGAKATEAEIIAYCREHMSGFKTPKSVVFGGDPEKHRPGKIQKFPLRTRGRLGQGDLGLERRALSPSGEAAEQIVQQSPFVCLGASAPASVAVHSISIGINCSTSATPAAVRSIRISRLSVGSRRVRRRSRRFFSRNTTSRMLAGSIATSRPSRFCDSAPRS